MKKLEELVKELGLKPSDIEIYFGRNGNYVHINYDNTYTTMDEFVWENYKEIIEVKPE